jgi:hypothetical protein
MMAVPSVQENCSDHLDFAADLRTPRLDPFLQRNLLWVVKYDAQGKKPLLKPTVTSSAVHSAFETPPKRRERPFTMKDFEQTVARQKEEEFSFHPKSIRRRTDVSTSSLTNGKEPLSKRLKRNEIQCQCTITIYYTRNKGEAQIVTRRSAQCSITTRSGDLDYPILDIQIEPFIFKASDLKICVRRHGADKMCISDSYTLRTSIFPLDGSDLSWPPIPEGRSEPSDLSIIQFTSKWLLRPGFSTEETLLPIDVLVKPINGTEQRPTSQANLGLQVAAAWAYPKSALEEYNLSRRKLDVLSTSLPTPRPEPESSSKDISRPVLTYKNAAAAKFIMLDPEQTCGHVKTPQEASLQKARVPPEIDSSHEMEELGLRLMTPQTPMTGLRTVGASSESGHPNAAQPLKRPGAIKQALAFNRTPSFAKQPQLRKETLNEGTGPSHPVPQPFISKSKRHPVPIAHHTTFFRLQSKRPLKEGDMLDESDDDFATSWLTQKHSQTLDEFAPLGLSERKFMKAYDSYMLSENLGPVCYLPDAILRFIASRKPWLKDQDISPEFFKLVTKLMVDGATPDDFIKTCRQMLYSAEKGKARACGSMESDEKAEGINTKKHDDMCEKCSQTITTRRHSMICSNKVRPSTPLAEGHSLMPLTVMPNTGSPEMRGIGTKAARLDLQGLRP